MPHYSSWDRGAHQLNFQNACYSLQLQALHHENFFLCFCVLEPGVRCHGLSIPWWGMDRFKIVQRCVKYVYLLITASFQYSVVSWFFHIFFYFHAWKTTYAFTHKPQIMLIAEPKPQSGLNPEVQARIRRDHESPVFPPNISKSTTSVGLSCQLALASCSWNERYVCMNNAWAIAKLILSPVFDAHLNRLEPWTYSNQ